MLNVVVALQDNSRSALGIGNVRGIFYILIIGLVISIVVAACEIFYNARVEARRSKVLHRNNFFFLL